MTNLATNSATKSVIDKAIEIVDLRDRPEYRDAVIRQNLNEWGAMTDIDLDMMSGLFDLDHSPDTLPITLIALSADNYVGCVSLRTFTMGALTHPEAYMDTTPWLSNMWVADAARGMGLATRMVGEVERLAREHGFSEVYLGTLQPDSLYHKAGYKDVLQRHLKDETMYIVRKSL